MRLHAIYQSRTGMTLIEIMIVVTIMASIMGVIGFHLLGAATNANVKLAQTELATIEQALNNDALDHNNRFPRDLRALVDGSVPYLDALKADPWGNDYVYILSGRQRATLRSSGPDAVRIPMTTSWSKWVASTPSRSTVKVWVVSLVVPCCCRQDGETQTTDAWRDHEQATRREPGKPRCG